MGNTFTCLHITGIFPESNNFLKTETSCWLITSAFLNYTIWYILCNSGGLNFFSLCFSHRPLLMMMIMIEKERKIRWDYGPWKGWNIVIIRMLKGILQISFSQLLKSNQQVVRLYLAFLSFCSQLVPSLNLLSAVIRLKKNLERSMWFVNILFELLWGLLQPGQKHSNFLSFLKLKV